MSHRGAIKKSVAESKSVTKARVSSRIKSNQSSDGSTEVLSTSESREVKISQHRDQKGAGDRKEKILQNSINKLGTSSSSSNKDKDKMISSQTKSAKKIITSSSSLKPGKINSPKYKEQLMTKATISESKLNRNKAEKRNTKNVFTLEENKSKEKMGAIYSEKRGKSSIYLPGNVKSSNITSNKTSKEAPGSKISSVSTREKPSLGRAESIDKTAKTMPRRSSRERKKSRTLSPSEVKILHSALKAGDMLNDGKYQGADSTGKTFTKQSKNNISADDDVGDYDYEDDFEDYESDFQECTDSEVSQVSEETESNRNTPEPEPIEMQREEQVKTINSADGRKSEEESMLDSGHYELSEARKRAARIESMSTNQQKTPPLPELRQPINRSYRREKTSEHKSLPLSSTDEGFEEGRSGDFTKSPPLSQISFIDFQKPKQLQVNKEVSLKSKRGEELLSMIKLDNVEWSLIEYTPIAYEDFIRNYGRLNTQQISVQTNEDNLEVETQTESIEFSNKWTQFPIACRQNLTTMKDVKLFKLEQIGVGEDPESELINSLNQPSYDILQLNEFLSTAGKVMLSLLEERRVGGNVLRRDSQELPFSEGFIKLDVDSVSFLTDRTVSFMHYSENLNKMLLTIHASNNEGIETSNKEDYLTDCCIGCVWSTSEPSRPIKLFYSPCSITACCFHPTNYNVVFAGLEDGSIHVWDLREDEMWHPKVADKVNEVDWVLRSATYTTADSIDENEHNSEIVAIRVVSHIDRDTSSAFNNTLAPIQICTLDEEGELIIWSVLYTMGIGVDDLGLAQWGDIRLQKSQQISLESRKDKTMLWWYQVH